MHTLMPAQAVSAVFDEPNLIGYGGLEPVVRLAERCGLRRLVDQLVAFKASVNGAGACPGAKVLSLVAGMVAGADSIQDVDRLRHGAMGKVFGGVRAPSTLGTFLVRHEALLLRVEVRDRPSPRRRSGGVKLEAA